LIISPKSVDYVNYAIYLPKYQTMYVKNTFLVSDDDNDDDDYDYYNYMQIKTTKSTPN
jgi:hypothetical protein